MSSDLPFIDASVFLGMHHHDPGIRGRSLALFRTYFNHGARMSLEQVGICDAVIWRQRRQVQDAYYPFMDLLHSEMAVERNGYSLQDINFAAKALRHQGLSGPQALLVAQTLNMTGVLFSHDPAVRGLSCLRGHLGDFSTLNDQARFPLALEELYALSSVYVHTDEEWEHVQSRRFHPVDHPN